jgi:hypothetical protein
MHGFSHPAHKRQGIWFTARRRRVNDVTRGTNETFATNRRPASRPARSVSSLRFWQRVCCLDHCRPARNDGGPSADRAPRGTGVSGRVTSRGWHPLPLGAFPFSITRPPSVVPTRARACVTKKRSVRLIAAALGEGYPLRGTRALTPCWWGPARIPGLRTPVSSKPRATISRMTTMGKCGHNERTRSRALLPTGVPSA